MSHYSQPLIEREEGPAEEEQTPNLTNSHTPGMEPTNPTTDAKPEPLNRQPQVPLPSQEAFPAVNSQIAPSYLFTETLPSADSSSSGSSGHNESSHSSGSDLNFAERANALINASLGRTPDGMSVIDPDSVLDECWSVLIRQKAEQDRLDLQHHLFKLVLDGWYALAPLNIVPEYVLDIATGTGIWALEFAEQHPQSYVIGTDLSAIQPNRDIPNCTFQKDDAEAEWVFRAPERPHGVLFDYVHLRMVCTCFDDTQHVMRQAFDNMTPGGWIEFQEIRFDTQHPNNLGTPLARWFQGLNQGLNKIGRDIERPKLYKTWLEEVGFVDVQEREFIIPCNPWPKDKRFKQIGLFQLQNLLDGLKSVGWKMLKLAGLTPEEIEQLVLDTKEYLRNTRHHPIACVHVIYGRKPIAEEMVHMPQSTMAQQEAVDPVNDVEKEGD